MKRSTPMKRTPLKRAGPTTTTVKPLKAKTCSKGKGGCGEVFTPTRAMQGPCGPICAMAFVAKAKAKSAAKAKSDELKADRAKLEAMKTIGRIEEECRKIVQKIARIRDRDESCISCELPPDWGGQWHGSHFRSHGAASAVQFNLWNVNKACWICNKIYSGRIDQYEPKLVAKIGQEKVDWLKSQNQVVKSDRKYLARFKLVMGKKMRRMEKRHALQS